MKVMRWLQKRNKKMAVSASRSVKPVRHSVGSCVLPCALICVFASQTSACRNFTGDFV